MTSHDAVNEGIAFENESAQLIDYHASYGRSAKGRSKEMAPRVELVLVHPGLLDDLRVTGAPDGRFHLS
jgi:hypothetical protein